MAPIKDTPYSYAQRALRVTENKNALYYEIEILKDLPITGTTADVIPWFGQVGNGKQTLLKFDTKYKNLQSLIDDGYIKINVKSSPNKLYTGYIGKVLEKEIVRVATRASWNGYENIYKANEDEILEAINRIKNHRTATGNLSGGNYGYLEGTVGTISRNGEMWRSVSTNDAINEIHIFDAIEAQGSSGTWLRITDSEYRMLNKLASDLNGVKGVKYPTITGELKIISENPYCASCTGIIQQFHEMYPNIKLILVDGAK